MLKSKNKLLHKTIAFVLTFSLLASLVSFNFTANAEITGEGTANNPYTIDTLDDLKTFASKVNEGESKYTNAYVKLADNSNITITDSWTPIGNAENKFSGVFDGNGKTITFSTVTDGDYVGLFGINEGTIKNVKIVGTISTNTELAFVGGVAGLNRGTITNCTNSATISATGANSYAGGIAGVMQNGTIESCKNSGDVTVTVSNNNSNDVTDHEASAGGIVAFNYNGTVKKCENTATITNDETHGYTGGIVGNNDGTINNCLNNGTVSNDAAADYVGGIAGNLFTNSDTGSTAKISNSLNTNDSGKVVGSNGINESNTGVVDNCYYKTSTTEEENHGAQGVTVDDLKTGSVTYKLNKNNVTNPVWGQTALNSDGSLPFIGASSEENNIVYPDTNSGYTNTKPNSDSCTHSYKNGSCTICGKVVGKVVGNTITLDGTIGLNFYFDIEKKATGKTITFEKDGKTIQGVLKSDSTTLTTSPVSDGCDRYVATIAIDSDQMNLPVTATLSVTIDNNETIEVESEEYTVNTYLNKLYTTSTSSELKELVMAMSTYGYYANRYFGDYPAYETTLPEYNLTANGNTINDTGYNFTYSGEDVGNIHHSASSLQHLEEIRGVFYATGVTDTSNTYMEYKKVSLNNSDIKDEEAKYSEVTGSGSSVYAITDKIPIAELSTTKFAVTFGTKADNDSYTPQTKTKYYAPYTYIRNILKKYYQTDDTKPSYKLAQALYHYSEAAKTYFDAASAATE